MQNIQADPEASSRRLSAPHLQKGTWTRVSVDLHNDGACRQLGLEHVLALREEMVRDVSSNHQGSRITDATRHAAKPTLERDPRERER